MYIKYFSEKSLNSNVYQIMFKSRCIFTDTAAFFHNFICAGYGVTGGGM